MTKSGLAMKTGISDEERNMINGGLAMKTGISHEERKWWVGDERYH